MILWIIWHVPYVVYKRVTRVLRGAVVWLRRRWSRREQNKGWRYIVLHQVFSHDFTTFNPSFPCPPDSHVPMPADPLVPMLARPPRSQHRPTVPSDYSGPHHWSTTHRWNRRRVYVYFRWMQPHSDAYNSTYKFFLQVSLFHWLGWLKRGNSH